MTIEDMAEMLMKLKKENIDVEYALWHLEKPVHNLKDHVMFMIRVERIFQDSIGSSRALGSCNMRVRQAEFASSSSNGHNANRYQ
jgi:hypothetical protein